MTTANVNGTGPPTLAARVLAEASRLPLYWDEQRRLLGFIGQRARRGLGDNPRVIQITAPVQAGNSGGPLLDKSGHVIGVVVSKLNAAKVYQVTGDLPQNINFAIKGSLVRGFLDIHGVDYRVGASDATVGNEAVAAMAQEFVVSVGCWK